MNRKKVLKLLLVGAGAVGAGVLLFLWRTDTDKPSMSGPNHPAQPLDLSAHADAPPATPLRLLFIHHSVGGHLLATPGADVGTNCIYQSHPNGGGLRDRLQAAAYEVREASYGSVIGGRTDIRDWPEKFAGQMDKILACDSQDQSYPDGRRNQIVVFKSCFPNNNFLAAGQAPGNPAGPGLTVWNAKAAYNALLAEFRQRPEVLFVCFTAPPQAPKLKPLSRVKQWVKALLGISPVPARRAALAREFNNWLSDRDGWLKNYPLSNVVVFDYYDILTDHGVANLSRYPTGGGYDSHPSTEGNQKAATAFVPLLNRAVRRAGLAP